jgi:ketosteroid isomerase-like protein
VYEAIAVVRSMWEAEIDGRLDDVLATMHRDIGSTPTTRPGLDIYFGRAGVRKMRENTDRALGARELVIDDISLLGDGSVLTRGHVISRDNPDARARPFEVVCRVRDGLIVRFDSREPGTA